MNKNQISWEKILGHRARGQDRHLSLIFDSFHKMTLQRGRGLTRLRIERSTWRTTEKNLRRGMRVFAFCSVLEVQDSAKELIIRGANLPEPFQDFHCAFRGPVQLGVFSTAKV
jgi:hypothetical protein